MVNTKKRDELRQLDRALAGGEERIKKQRETIGHDLVSRDSTPAEAVLDAMVLAQSERKRYRSILLARLTKDDLSKPE
jgi:hypothetical protein